MVDPLSSTAPSFTSYRYAFNNPLIFTDYFGLFETKDEAKEYVKNEDIKYGIFSRNKIRQNDDGSHVINNRKEKTSIVNDKDFGVVKGALVIAEKNQENQVSLGDLSNAGILVGGILGELKMSHNQLFKIDLLTVRT